MRKSTSCRADLVSVVTVELPCQTLKISFQTVSLPDGQWAWRSTESPFFEADDVTDGQLEYSLVISSQRQAWKSVSEEILERTQALGYSDQEVFAIQLALDEAIINAIGHGNGFDETKMVQVDYSVGKHEIRVRITDEGNGFDPDALSDPTAAENLDCPGGRGVMLMRHYMCGVFFNESGNSVEMWKRRGAAST